MTADEDASPKPESTWPPTYEADDTLQVYRRRVTSDGPAAASKARMLQGRTSNRNLSPSARHRRRRGRSDKTARDQGRDRGLLQSFASGAILQLVVVAGQLVSLPAVTNALGSVRYGVFVSITSTIAILGLADIGVGAGVTAAIAEARSSDDEATQRRVVASGGLTLFAIALILALLGLATSAISYVSWDTDSLTRSDLSLSILVLGVGAGLTVSSGVGLRILVGLQETHVATAAMTVSSALTAATAISLSTVVSSVWVFLAITFAVPSCVGFGLTIWCLVSRHRYLRPTRADVDRARLVSLIRSSGSLFALQITLALSYQTDTLVIASTIGVVEAGVFATSWRFYTLLAQGLGITGRQLWSAFIDAWNRGDTQWIRQRLQSTILVVGLIFTLSTGAIVALGPPLIETWLGSEFVPSRTVLLVMGVWAGYSTCFNVISIFLNAIERVRIQIVFALTMVTLNLPLSIFLAREIGMSGPLLASLVTHVATYGLPATICATRELRAARLRNLDR